jgi:hypothetical protein
MNDWGDLPSQRELDRFANWGFVTVGAMAVAAGVTFGLSKLAPGLPAVALTAIFGVLMIPFLVAFGITFRHMLRSLQFRKAEQREGRIVYTNRLGAFVDQHPLISASFFIGAALLGAVIWTLLENR